jgi:hypothetical protein
LHNPFITHFPRFSFLCSFSAIRQIVTSSYLMLGVSC